MKYRTTKKNIRETENRIICVTYCRLQNLLATTEPFAYSSRTEGWACDYYEIPRGICISTGYSPIGKHIEYDFLRQYDEAAQKICYETYDWQERKRRLDALLEDFAGDVERLYFNGNRTTVKWNGETIRSYKFKGKVKILSEKKLTNKALMHRKGKVLYIERS